MSAINSISAFCRTIHANITEMSQAGEVRRTASKLCSDLGFSEAETGTVAIIIAEIAKNLVKHAGAGEIIIRPFSSGGFSWLDILGLDKGPGMNNIGQCLQNGHSTAGSPGTGLGAISRLSTVFDVFSVRDRGTVLLSRFAGEKGGHKRPKSPVLEMGAVCVPIKGEDAPGDGWAVGESNERTLLMVVDGLGHGALASEAAREAERIFREHLSLGSKEMVEHIHAALKKTRGAVVAVAEVLHRENVVKYTGVGNISALLHSAERSRNMVSMNGTIGGEVRKIQEYSYPWAPCENGRHPLLIMNSDGLATLSGLDRYPGLENRHPALVAGILYRDFTRGRDDAVVLVAGEWKR
jgi:anti-sigma regulatory factor (Ser/Thr protein kinase)